MAFKTILIDADDEQRLPSLLEVAGTIAARYNAHVIGLAVVPQPIRIPIGMPGTPQILILERHRAAFRAAAERMKVLFDRALAGKPVTSEWRLEDDAEARLPAVEAATSGAADLIVTSDKRPDQPGMRPWRKAERIVLEAGRPVILVPRAALHSSIGRRVLVAWNGSREATRAAFDALPLLQMASEVTVLQLGIEETAPTTPLSSAALCEAIARHGVRAKPEELALPRAPVGAAMLSAVKAVNADLLVMGGYGRGRLQELVLGGATEHVLRHMSVPVLMSH